MLAVGGRNRLAELTVWSRASHRDGEIEIWIQSRLVQPGDFMQRDRPGGRLSDGY